MADETHPVSTNLSASDVPEAQPSQAPPSTITPQLQKVVATANLEIRIDLNIVARQARNADYKPKRSTAVVLRIREPKATALIFASGKMVITGARSELDARLAGRKFARIVAKCGYHPKFLDFKVQNIVGSADVGHCIRLEGMERHIRLEDVDKPVYQKRGAAYDPDLFPGLILRWMDPRVVFLVFVSGRVVITGAKTCEQLYEGFRKVLPYLKYYVIEGLAQPVRKKKKKKN